MNRHIRRQWEREYHKRLHRYPHVFTIDRLLTDDEEKHLHGYFLDPKNGCSGLYMHRAYSGEPLKFEEGWYGHSWATTKSTTFFFTHVETMMMFRLMISK
ncbi:MAG: hypothetical protein EOP83_10035 [Verrucomicrobiaceae bacterium]|nr:MAG: hypothetical protein EOP83_10035 [Verrucomicrobiaceae bacterium]